MTHAHSPIGYLQSLQVMVATELVEERGLPSARAAPLLGVAPSAISQYLTGKRLAGAGGPFPRDEEARRIARRTADRLLAMRAGEEGERARALFDGAQALVALQEGVGTGLPVPPDSLGGPEVDQTRELVRWGRARVRAEQRAVAQSMRLAQKARDELTRAVFRQIASDSLRHAEIVASLEPYWSRGVAHAPASGITRRDVEALIRDEQRAESGPAPALLRGLGGTLALLLESIGADERKHDRLLAALLDSGFAGTPGGRRDVAGVRARSRYKGSRRPHR